MRRLLPFSPHLLVFPSLALLLVFFHACKDESTPPPPAGTDTSSHNWSFSFDTLGATASVFSDIAIVNDSLAYAVGEIYSRDSTGQIDPIAYSAAIWNGSRWTLRRLYYGSNNLIVSVRGIFVFGMNDIWLAAGSIFHWDGISSQAQLSFSRLTLPDPNATVEKLWGTMGSDLFGVGNAATIVHNANGIWNRLESGTTLPINDIWGSRNSQANAWEILCVASNQFLNQGSALLSIRGLTVTSLPDSGLSWALNTIWFVSGRRYYIGGDGLYPSNTIGPVWSRDTMLPPYYKTAVRGNGVNDIVVVGAFGLVLHFNGATWQDYRSVTGLASGAYTRVAMRNNLFIAVGGTGTQAVVLVGRR